MLQKKTISVLVAVWNLSVVQASSPPAPVKVTVKPERPLIERRETVQLINFDFVVENTGTKPLHLNRIEISIFDSENKLQLRRQLDENGRPSGMTTIEKRDLTPGTAIGIFNPFFSFGEEVSLAKLANNSFSTRLTIGWLRHWITNSGGSDCRSSRIPD